jgi:hypothetical protein
MNSRPTQRLRDEPQGVRGYQYFMQLPPVELQTPT